MRAGEGRQGWVGARGARGTRWGHPRETVVLRVVEQTVRESRTVKWSRAVRHSFATLLVERGTDNRTLHELLGHADVTTKMNCTHVLDRGPRGVRSGLDRLRLCERAGPGYVVLPNAPVVPWDPADEECEKDGAERGAGA